MSLLPSAGAGGEEGEVDNIFKYGLEKGAWYSDKSGKARVSFGAEESLPSSYALTKVSYKAQRPPAGWLPSQPRALIYAAYPLGTWIDRTRMCCSADAMMAPSILTTL